MLSCNSAIGCLNAKYIKLIYLFRCAGMDVEFAIIPNWIEIHFFVPSAREEKEVTPLRS